MSRRFLMAALALVSSFTVSHVSAQRASVPLQQLAPGATFESFGSSLAFDQDTLVVGATNADGVVARTGAAYVYVRSGGLWVQQARLVASDGVTQAAFGSSVKIRGDLIAVGATHHAPAGNPKGRAYVYRRSGTNWSEEAVLPLPVDETNPLFGSTVAIGNESVLVGAPNGGGTAGVVYRFDHVGPNWVWSQTITPHDPVPNLWFGQSLALDGTRLAIGAHSSLFPTPGAVYMFVLAGANWSLEEKIQPPRLATAGLGSCLALQQDQLLVGCPGVDAFGSDAGAAILFRRGASGWERTATLTECWVRQEFATDVGMDQDILLVAKRSDHEAGAFMGSVHVYQLQGTQWVEQTKVVVPDAQTTSGFLGPILVAGDRVFVGTPQASGTGRVREFQLAPASYPSVCVATPQNGTCSPCNASALTIAGSGCESSALNCGTQLVATGVASLAAEDLVLRARGLPITTVGVLLQGSTLGPPVPFFAGAQCIGGSLRRIAMRVAQGGTWAYPQPADAPISVQGAIPGAGAQFHYQLAYRDAAGFCGDQHANMTNGVSVTWTP